MAKGLGAAVALACAMLAMPAAGTAAPAEDGRFLVGAPVYLDGSIRYGVIERVIKAPDGSIRTIVVRPDAPTSDVYALDWSQVRVDPRSGAITMPDEAAQLATVPERR